ncbi:hypothetical protein [Paraburkholderia fungorum]|uniref:Uncharacterized protein n=1 Tax=Paraburkholderia fungorum TaxID=134537 RepID=A0AAP5UYK3_9BURK|nr:hypothetical protein [Paraburkholderia fungorum]MDT8843493.1 hypothetical protein [Paraburkholderia fungorum]
MHPTMPPASLTRPCPAGKHPRQSASSRTKTQPGAPFASSLQIFDRHFLKQDGFLISVQLAKFAEHFGDCTLSGGEGKGSADVRATSCQFKHVSCASIGRGAAACIARGIRSLEKLKIREKQMRRDLEQSARKKAGAKPA